MAEGAVASEPFSAANREEFRKFSRSLAGCAYRNPATDTDFSQSDPFCDFAKQGINREIPACNLRILYEILLRRSAPSMAAQKSASRAGICGRYDRQCCIPLQGKHYCPDGCFRIRAGTSCCFITSLEDFTSLA